MKDEQLKEPSILLAIVGLFIGYPILFVGSILLMPFTFVKSIVVFNYFSPLWVSVIWGIGWFICYTIPTILYFNKTIDSEDFVIYKLFLFIAYIVLLIIIFSITKLNFLIPDYCLSALQSNVTTSGLEYICK